MDALLARLGLPLVVKPARSGSALGCSLVEAADELPDAMVNAFAYGSVALIESYVRGTEVAVPVVDDGSGPRALPAVAIRPDGAIYDYTARYTAGSTEFMVPAELPADVLAECARVAVAAHEALGLRDLSRSDLIVGDDGTVWFLEVNVAPGFTETSLVPLSVEAAGLDLGEVLASLVRAASARDARTRYASSELTYSAIIRLAKLGFRALGQRITVHRAEHIPRTGGALLAVNHISYVDFVYAGIPVDKVGRRAAVHGQARALRPPHHRPDHARLPPHRGRPRRR